MTRPMARTVAITDASELLAPGVELLQAAGAAVDVLPDGLSPADAAERVADATAVIIGVMPFRAAEIARLRATRLLIRAGIGYDVIDVDAATSAGIWVANVPDYCVDEVADHTVLLALAAARRLPEIADLWRSAGRWGVAGMLPPVRRIRGQRFGVIGYGRIGREVAARASGFGWDVVVSDPYLVAERALEVGAVVELDELIATSDVITLHCPLTDATRGLLNERRLATVKSGVTIVNTSRGGLIELDALDRAVADGRVAAAALDVLDGEPAPDLDHPLLSRPNVLVTPHVAWYSLEARRDLALRSAEEALRLLDGTRPRNLVNPGARSLDALG
jgi:D-3-phosphoglycerate dehydrogenase / 2-oxoglutarate reductase